jgi:glycerol kinase
VSKLAAEADGDERLFFGTIDTWLIAKLTGMKSIVTDSTNACRTMLMNLHTLEWDEENLKMFDVKKCYLPEIKKSSSDLFGTVEESECAALKGVPITGVLGDQQAACLGHILRTGQVKTTYGTGCFILQNVGDKPVISKHGLLGTVCYRIGDKTQYALEGAVEIAGAAIQWAKSVGIITDVKNIEKEALEVEDCGDVYFVAAFGGLLTPHYRDDARGLMIGMS